MVNGTSTGQNYNLESDSKTSDWFCHLPLLNLVSTHARALLRRCVQQNALQPPSLLLRGHGLMRRVHRQASGLLALSLIGSTAQPQHAGVKLASEPSAWVTTTSAFS